MKLSIPKDAPKRVRLTWAALVCVVLALVFELVFANFYALFSFDRTNETLDLAPYCENDIITQDGSYLLPPSQQGAATMKFADVPGGISSLSFEIRYTDEAVKDGLPVPTLTVTATDPRTTWQSKGRITIATEQFAVGEGGAFRTVTVYASLDSNGVGDVDLSFTGLDGIVELRNVRLNAPPAFAFSFVRFLLVALACFIPCLLAVTGLWYTDYDPSNARHRHGAKTAAVFTVLLSLLFVSGFLYDGSSIPYPLEGTVRSYQPYIQQFDAFVKGQLHLDVPVSDELLALENPYDYLTRADADPLWDRAYYDGKYYSYFGVTPIVLVYFPYYLLSGELPADSFVMTVFLLIAAVFVPLTVLKWADLHERKRIPLPVVWLGAVTAFIGSCVLLIARSVTPFYYIATLAGTAFLSAFLYLLLKAAEAERLRDRVFFYVLAGLAYALMLHARLNVALLAAFIVVPYIVFRILKRRSSPDATEAIPETPPRAIDRLRGFFAPPKEILCSLLALGLPVAVALGVLLCLNAARFDSILEFGTSYQLTVSDVRYNELSLGDLFPAVYHYFFQTLEVSSLFPYLSISRESIADYGHFVYTDASFGLFALPLMNALWLTPAVCLLKHRTRYEKTLLLCLLAGLLTVALLDFSLGGVIYRYVADLTLLSALGAVFLVFAALGAVNGGADATVTAPSVKRASILCALLFFLVSSAFALLLSISYNGNLTKYPSELFIALKELLPLG